MKVVNVMKDGTVRDSMEGIILPEELSKQVFQIILRVEDKKRGSNDRHTNYPTNRRHDLKHRQA